MDNTKDTRFCTFCHKDVTFHIDAVDHRKEFIRTICTLGFWLPLWLAMTFGRAKLCDICGNALWEE